MTSNLDWSIGKEGTGATPPLTNIWLAAWSKRVRLDVASP